jgi:hypothetical protein
MVERIIGLVSHPLVISMLIGLVLGYDLRERRRRAVVRKRCYQKYPEQCLSGYRPARAVP